MIEQLISKFFTCDPLTGDIFWKIDNGKKCKAGDKAGTIRKDGRNLIRIKGHQIYGYRVIWFLSKGFLPIGQIDHIDRNPSNDSLVNLREVTNEVNSWNRGSNSNSKTGCKGIIKYGKKFSAFIHIKGKTKYLGSFASLEEAILMREVAESEHLNTI